MIGELIWIVIIITIVAWVVKGINEHNKMVEIGVAKLASGKEDDERWIPASALHTTGYQPRFQATKFDSNDKGIYDNEIKTQDEIEYPEEPNYPDRTDADLIEFDLDE